MRGTSFDDGQSAFHLRSRAPRHGLPSMAGCLLAFVLSACGAGDEGFADAEGQGAALSGADSKQTVRGDLRSPVGPVDSALVPTKPSATESQPRS